MNVSILIVTRGRSEVVDTLSQRLHDLLAKEAPDTTGEVLVIAEDAGVTEVAARETLESGAALVRIPSHRGLGYNRNRALEAANGDVVIFVDDDCWPADDWLGELLRPLADPAVDGVMGNVHIKASTFLGDSISALGFPAGGSVGFAVMFPVDADGFTSHVSTLNCALRESAFARAGRFDESMVAGAEDGELSHRMMATGIRVKFQPTAVVDHAARESLSEFSRWFFRRGQATRQFSRRAPVSGTIGRRVRSYSRVLWLHRADPKLVAIIPLLGASVLLQQAGFMWELLTGEDVRG